MTQAIVKADAILTPTPIEFNEDQLKVITNTICKGATPTELDLFVSTCKRTGLDPFMRQIYAVKRYDAQAKGQVMAIQIGIDGQRLIAERTGKYDGQDPVEWLDTNGVWSEVWTAVGEFPVAARCSVYRKDWTNGRKATAVCRWDSYAQRYGQERKLMPTWDAMPDVMLGKCAESLALRRAFPAEMSAVAAMAGQGYDPSYEVDDYSPAEDRTDAIEGSFTPVEEPVDPIQRDTKDAITKTYLDVKRARADFPVAVLAPMQERWGEALKSKNLNLLTETEGQAMLTFLNAAMPATTPCDHDPQFSEDTTLLTCIKCGVVLEEGPPEPPGPAEEPAAPGLPLDG